MGLFQNDVAVSLVDDAFMFCEQTQKTPVVVPAYVAVQAGTNRVLACGEEARAMRGREPNNIVVVRVLAEGLVTDFEAATALFRFGLKKAVTGPRLIRPRVIVAFRSTYLGKRPIKDIAIAGGVREVYLIEMGMATAIGMGLDVQKPELKAVLSVSDDWFEFAVISLAGVLCGINGAIGTKAFVEDIQNHVAMARHFRPETAAIESQLLSAGMDSSAAIDVPGWEVWAGRAEQGRFETQSLSREDISVGLMPSLIRMTERIKAAIRTLPSDKQSQLSHVTIHGTGAALRISGLAQSISNQMGYVVKPFASEVHPSIEGARVVLKELKFLSRVSRVRG